MSMRQPICSLGAHITALLYLYINQHSKESQLSQIFPVKSEKIAGLQLKMNHTELTPPLRIRSHFYKVLKKIKLLGSYDCRTYQISLQKPPGLPQQPMAMSETVGHTQVLSFLYYSHINPQLQTPLFHLFSQSLLNWSVMLRSPLTS